MTTLSQVECGDYHEGIEEGWQAGEAQEQRIWRMAIERYFDGTAVEDVERYVEKIRAGVQVRRLCQLSGGDGMTGRKQALIELLEKVEAGKAPKDTPAYEFALYPIKGMWSAYKAMDAYHGSLDAAKALHDAVLRGHSAIVDLAGDCDIYGDTGDGDWEWLGCSSCQNNPARAWLIAIIKALIAQGPEQ